MDRNPNPKQIPLTRAMVQVLHDAELRGRSYYVTAAPSTYNAMLSRGLIVDTGDGVRLTTEGVRTMNSLA